MSSSSLDSIYGLNRLRVTSMNSGLDTDSIISSIMKVEQMKIDKQFKAMTQKEWKRDQIRDVNKQIQDFRNEFMSTLGGNASKNILSAMNFKGYKVTSDDTQSRATMTASTSAANGTYVLNAVDQLATAGKQQSTERLSSDGNGINSTSQTLGELAASGALEGLFEGDDGEFTPQGTLTINNVEIGYTVDDTLQSLMNKVNNSNAGVTMSYSQLTDKVAFTSKTTGEGSTVFMEDTGNLLEAFKIEGGHAQLDENNKPIGKFYAGEGQKGQDAIAYINDVRVKRSTNSFSIDGVNYNLKKTFNTDFESDENGRITPGHEGDKSQEITFEVAQDVDKAVDMIKGFVEGYNKLVLSLTSMLAEKPNSDYSPLTDEEREALSESQIEKWDTESKKGLLYKDSNLSNLLSNMRSAFFQEVEGTGLSLAEIGIAPGSSVVDGVYSGTQSDIVIDEEKLRKALEADPDRVAQMFMGGSALPDDKMSTAGLGNRLIKLTNGYKNTTSEIQSAALDYEIDKLDDKMESMKERMSAQEELLYKKYSAMETALSKLQSQGNWFAQQFGG